VRLKGGGPTVHLSSGVRSHRCVDAQRATTCPVYLSNAVLPPLVSEAGRVSCHGCHYGPRQHCLMAASASEAVHVRVSHRSPPERAQVGDLCTSTRAAGLLPPLRSDVQSGRGCRTLVTLDMRMSTLRVRMSRLATPSASCAIRPRDDERCVLILGGWSETACQTIRTAN
jgi:hypothetical protein